MRARVMRRGSLDFLLLLSHVVIFSILFKGSQIDQSVERMVIQNNGHMTFGLVWVFVIEFLLHKAKTVEKKTVDKERQRDDGWF